MTREELVAMMEVNQQLAESLGGLRKAIIAQGFSEQAAEAIIVSQITKGDKK